MPNYYLLYSKGGQRKETHASLNILISMEEPK